MLRKKVDGAWCRMVNLGVWAALVGLWVANGAFADRQIIPLDGTWQVEEGTMDTMPTVWRHRVPVPGFVDMASPPFEDVGRTTEAVEAAIGSNRRPLVPDPRREAYWYRRTFRLTDPIPKVAQLQFDKAKYGTTVWLNGHEVGSHWPNFTPGHFDVKHQLKGEGQDNELVVRLGASPLATSGKSHDGRDFEKIRYLAGIYDSVALILSGSPHILRVQVAPNVEAGTATVVAWLKNSASTAATTDVEFTVRPYRGKRAVGTAKMTANELQPGEERRVESVVSIADCRLWSPEDPFLYRLETRTSGDEIATRFGMRSFRFDPKSRMALLNGKPYPMLGTNVCFFRFEEDFNREGKPWDDTWVRKLHRQFKSMHWNSARYCIGLPPELWYRIADEEGLLIQDEFPVWTLNSPLETSEAQLVEEYTEWMQAHWNYPSVVIWDAQNESREEEAPQTGAALGRVRSLDLTKRPWDNGWANPQAPTDMVEKHSYPMSPLMRNGQGDFAETMRQFGQEIRSGKYAKVDSELPAVLNEYGWLWLSREGMPTALTQAGYAIALPQGTVEERRALYAQTLAAMTEAYRSLGTLAGVLHFCGLGHSIPDCYTSDNFLDLDSLEFEPHFKQYVGDVFAPVGLMADLWERRLDPGENRSVGVVVINDSPEEWEGEVTVTLYRAGKQLWRLAQQSRAFPLQRVRLTFDIALPRTTGDYRLAASLRGADRKTVHSVRFFSIGP